MAVATKDKLVTLEEVKALKDNIAIPSVELQITTGQWSGSSGYYTYSVNATNVTSTTKIDWAMDSSIDYLTNDLVVTPGSGTIGLSTSSLPTGTINVTLFFPGVQGEVVVQVLSDVYSKSQTDALISQSTALMGGMAVLSKSTSTAGGTVTFTFTGNRYTALLFITNNGGTSGIYGISFKANNTKQIAKLVGTAAEPSVDSATGSISVALHSWSTVKLLSDSPNEFS